MERLDRDSAVACSLNDEEFGERRAMARRTLIPSVSKCERTENGVVFTFRESRDIRQNIEEFVNLERQCCGFLIFEVIDYRCCQPPVVRLSGPPEASATLDMFAKSFEAGRV